MPYSVVPQGWPAPALRCANLIPPATGAGVALLAVVPLPSWPELLCPQQYATPSGGASAQVCLPPALTNIKLIPVVEVTSAVALFPSLVAVIVTWPKWSASTTPVALTVAIAGLLLAQVI